MTTVDSISATLLMVMIKEGNNEIFKCQHKAERMDERKLYEDTIKTIDMRGSHQCYSLVMVWIYN